MNRIRKINANENALTDVCSFRQVENKMKNLLLFYFFIVRSFFYFQSCKFLPSFFLIKTQTAVSDWAFAIPVLFRLILLGESFLQLYFLSFQFFVCLANGIGKSICTLFACKDLVLNKYFSYKEQENYLKLIIVSGGKI